jgi:ribose-phosphate pyrophosphokinase
MMITVQGFDSKFWTFPGGERSVKLTPDGHTHSIPLQVLMNFKGSDDLIDMILTVNALRHMYGHDIKIDLQVPYFPFSRQDRVMTDGESFGLQSADDIIKMCNFNKVTTWDIHSDVAGAMFPAGVFHNISQEDIWSGIIQDTMISGKTVIISPDAGALKKIYKVAKETGLTVVEAKKVRDVATGQIMKTEIDSSQLAGVDTAIIVDDICDGGRTFTELSKVIRESGFQGELILCVTHGIFSKGLDVFDGPNGFDSVYTVNNINNVDIDAFNNRIL